MGGVDVESFIGQVGIALGVFFSYLALAIYPGFPISTPDSAFRIRIRILAVLVTLFLWDW